MVLWILLVAHASFELFGSFHAEVIGEIRSSEHAEKRRTHPNLVTCNLYKQIADVLLARISQSPRDHRLRVRMYCIWRHASRYANYSIQPLVDVEPTMLRRQMDGSFSGLLP